MIAPCIPSVLVFPAANWHERETFDMFGISFSIIPILKRILMWDEYPYFPCVRNFLLLVLILLYRLRCSGSQLGFGVEPAPMMGGPFVLLAIGRMSDSEPRAKDESWTEKTRKTIYEYYN